MRSEAFQKCIDPFCSLEYPITDIRIECDRGHLLDIKYKSKPSSSLKEVFYKRRNHSNNIFNESGVWRFRELLNFCQIDTENIDECSKYLVSLDGAEGRLSKPYHMSKVSDYVGVQNMWLQPEGYNPSGSFKDNGMATAVTHAKLVNIKKIICASTGNTSASAAMYAANENMECDVYIPAGEVAPGKLSQAFQFGSQVIEIKGNFDDALSASLKRAGEVGGYTVNSVNPFRI
ncbi:MAG: pyridoxal-phosphate dependent enzyme, partial [Nitrosotalea sp.]